MLWSSQLCSGQWLLFGLARPVEYLVLFAALDLLFSVKAFGWLQQAALLDAPLGLPPFSLSLSQREVLY
jgi:hypothetical protein